MRLQDVAKKANVSVATASRVVNGLDTVNANTRRRVLAVLEELNYTPNLQARSLVSGQSKTIGIIVSNLENPFFVEIFHRLETEAHDQGYEVLLANTNYQSEHLARAIRMMTGRQVAGIAVAVSEILPNSIRDVFRTNTPVVCFGSDIDPQHIARIHFDTRKGIFKLVEHLYALGHRRMAYFGRQLSLATTQEREDAFVECARTLEIDYLQLKLTENDGPRAGRDAVRELVRRNFDATAILCLNDITALGVLRELRTRNIRVPEDVSVTGFDNISLSEFACPSLTTVQIPCNSVGRIMFKMLTSLWSGEQNPTEYLIDTEIVIRESTGPFQGGGLMSCGAS